VALSTVVVPRLERQRLIDRLKKEPVVWDLGFDNRNALDRLLGFDAPLRTIWFKRKLHSKDDTLTKEVLEAAARISPVYESINVDNLRVEPCERYPRAERITLRNLTGERATEWLSGLLAAQNHTKDMEIEIVPAFSDKHLEILSGIVSIESIWITRASVSGVGFREFSKIDREIEIIIENCPITNDGLKAIAECSNIKELEIGFTCPLPDLRLLMHAPRSLQLIVGFEADVQRDDPELDRTIEELDEYFGYPVEAYTPDHLLSPIDYWLRWPRLDGRWIL